MGVLARMLRRLGLAMVMVSTGTGCGSPSSPSQSNFSQQQRDAGSDIAGGEIGEVDATFLPTIDGTWLFYFQLSTCVDIIDSYETLTRNLYIVESVQDDSGVLTETWEACAVELTPLLGLTPAVTPALLETSYPIVVEGGLVSGTQIGDGYASAPVAELWGLDMEDPVVEPFPEDENDPRIVDSDGDGKPAATLVFGTFCEAYVAQRTLNHYSGAYIAPDRIAGTAVVVTKQIVVDATESLCATSYDTRSNDPRNAFERVRIDGQGGSLNLDENGDGEITCGEVLPFREVLFERVEVDDDTCR